MIKCKVVSREVSSLELKERHKKLRLLSERSVGPRSGTELSNSSLVELASGLLTRDNCMSVSD